MDGDTPRRPVALSTWMESNRAELEALRVSPRQEHSVLSVVDSLTEVMHHPHARPITASTRVMLIGFVMIADEVGSPDYIPQYLVLLIDERYQVVGTALWSST